MFKPKPGLVTFIHFIISPLGPVQTTPGEFENASITVHFGFVFFKKLRLHNVFCPHENKKPAFSNSSGLKSVFEKLRSSFRYRERLISQFLCRVLVSIYGLYHKDQQQLYLHAPGLN